MSNQRIWRVLQLSGGGEDSWRGEAARSYILGLEHSLKILCCKCNYAIWSNLNFIPFCIAAIDIFLNGFLITLSFGKRKHVGAGLISFTTITTDSCKTILSYRYFSEEEKYIIISNLKLKFSQNIFYFDWAIYWSGI